MSNEYNQDNLINSMQRSVSSHLGDIEFVKPLNRGTSGFVYLIKTRKAKDYQAVKVIWKGHNYQSNPPNIKKHPHDKNQEIRLKAKNQITIHQSIKSKFIVKFIGQIEDQQNFYLILEYCEEGDLSNLLKQNPNGLPINQVKKLGLEIAKGIDSLHKKRIVHRDLKPQNILLSKDQIKICDFGYAQKLQNTKIKGVVGTINYMAPQIFSLHDQKVDVWSYGCILHYLATGKQPFCLKQLKDIPTFFKEQNFKNYQYSLSIPELLVNLLKKIFILDPQQRISMQQIIQHPFFKSQNLIINQQPSFNLLNKSPSFMSEKTKRNHQKQNNIKYLNTGILTQNSYKQLEKELINHKLGKNQNIIKNKPSIRQNIIQRTQTTLSLHKANSSDIIEHQNRPLLIDSSKLSPLNIRRLGKMQMETSKGKIVIDENGFTKQPQLKSFKSNTHVHITPDGQIVTIRKGGQSTKHSFEKLPQKYKGIYKFCKDVVFILKDNNPVVKLQIGNCSYKLMHSGRMVAKIGDKKIDILNKSQIDSLIDKKIRKYYDIMQKMVEQEYEK